jgi:hypothetical protein
MRKIKFRLRFENISTNEKATVQASLLEIMAGAKLRPYDKWRCVAKDEYSGLNDSNDVEIYENDVVEVEAEKYYGKPSKFPPKRGVIKCDSGMFTVVGIHILYKVAKRSEVVGNLHDEPKLIETTEVFKYAPHEKR